MAPASPEKDDRTCFICSKSVCNTISHRLQTLEMSRRLERREGRPKTQSGIGASQVSELSQLRPLEQRKSRIPNRSSPVASYVSCESFPVKNATKTTINYFNRFFSSQQRSVLRSSLIRSQEGLCFDIDHYQSQFSEATRNSALCLSFVAMSATYVAVHDRRLESPDDTLTIIYNRAFQSLRQQLRKERASGGIPSESTVLAAINLSMACGVAFCDAEAALTHWQGVLALVPWTSRQYYSGTLNIFLEQTMYWLAIVAHVEPGFLPWPVILPTYKQLPEIYGHAWQPLLAIIQDKLAATRVLEFCTHVCRATEVLENRVRFPDDDSLMPSVTYFQYLRSIIEQKGAIMIRESYDSSTTIEAAVLAVNIFYCLVLAVTPWKAPVVYLCSQLQRVITRSTNLNTAIINVQQGICLDDSHLFTIWLLFIHLHAARICKDERLLRWTKTVLSPLLEQVARTDSLDQTWQKCLLDGLKRFCWSESFMAETFNQACDDVQNASG